MRIASGKYFLVGGGPAARAPGEPFMQRFIDEAGGSETRLTIITAGTADPEEVNGCYWDIFTRLGVRHLFSPKITCREDAEQSWLFDRIAESTAIFIAGGSQEKLADRLNGTAVEYSIRAVLERGGILGGTSSGSSIYGGPMILEGGTVDRHLRHNMIETGRGFGIIGEDVSIDTHCSSRGRVPRNLSLLIDQPDSQIIAIDEDTVFYIDNGYAEVMGYNAVYILDGRHSSAAHRDPDSDHLCAANVLLHCLMQGDQYDLNTRQPLSVRQVVTSQI